MNPIDRIAKLRELEAKAKRRDPDEMALCDYTEELRNAAPKLFDALDFRAGDAEVLNRVADDAEQMAKFVAGFGKPDMSTVDVLRRYQAMAQRMEAKNK